MRDDPGFFEDLLKDAPSTAGDPGELVMWIQSKHWRRRNVLAEDRQRERSLPHPTLHSAQESDGLGEVTHTGEGNPPDSVCRLGMLISSRNTLTDRSRNNV